VCKFTRADTAENYKADTVKNESTIAKFENCMQWLGYRSFRAQNVKNRNNDSKTIKNESDIAKLKNGTQLPQNR
jgi:hypothetical protein